MQKHLFFFLFTFIIIFYVFIIILFFTGIDPFNDEDPMAIY